MKRIETRLKESKKELICEEFKGLNELIRITSSREPDINFRDSDGLARTGVDNRKKPWSGEHTFEEAERKFTLGDEKCYKALKSQLDVKTSKATSKNSKLKTYNDVVGFTPNVPNAVMNLPQSMINSRMLPRKTKIIDILVDTSHSCSVSTERIAAYGSRVVRAVQALEKAGYRVRLTAFADFCTNYSYDSDAKDHVCKVVLKTESQPLDLKKIAYPLIGAGTLRRILFDWYESLPGHTYISGYGYPMSSWSGDYGKKHKKELLEAIRTSQEQIYIDSSTDIEEALGLERRTK